MWLLPVFAPVASLALRVFYRLSRSGGAVPRQGPVLLVANHPNSLLDPAAVVAAAGRPVRFLAKAPLFADPLVGWLVRGAGAIPVYRRQDDPASMGNNEDTFRRVHEALAGGAAVGIFPEGTSHSEPALAPLKTGAARIALGGAALAGAFPIVPIGLVFREKERFRTEALILVGDPVRWQDLAPRGEADFQAVDELTARIEGALRAVTVNLERWEDEQLVETAVAVHAAEVSPLERDADRVARLREATAALARLRQGEPERWRDTARSLRAHARALRVLGMSPETLKAGNRVDVAAEWLARQALFFGLGLPITAAGVAIYALPYAATAFVESRMRPTEDVRGTVKLLVGGVAHSLWTVLLAALAAVRWGWWAAAVLLVALPLIGWTTVHVVERFRGAAAEARRFLLRERRRETLDDLRKRQRALARRLHDLWLAAATR